VKQKFRLAILNSHPIQYFSPLYKKIAESDDIDLHVYYCSRQGLDEYRDAGFGRQIKWDLQLVDGFKHMFLRDVFGRQRVGGFCSLINFDIIKALRLGNFDGLLVHGHSYATNLLAIVVAKMLNIPVYNRTESQMRQHRGVFKKIFHKMFYHSFFNFFSGFFFIGALNKQFYQSYGVEDSKLYFVPYVVDNERFQTRDAAFGSLKASFFKNNGISENKRIILFASKLMQRKRPMDLLKAYENIHACGIDAQLLFVGDGPELCSLQNYSKMRALTGVHFLGFKNQCEIPFFYQLADIFVLPSENEPWGLVVNEAMNAGLAVIATNEVGASDDLIMHGKTGFTYPAGDIEMLTKYLQHLLENRETCLQMGDNALKHINEWNYEKCIKGISQACPPSK
jgi:glycosyltransferase involved in cell wall biosynthesis